ncbi:Hsp20/alpha crystallin family protein [Salipaludibacillus sp. LMS25]|jgi:HSP20 family protein|uniref:Hsp20/alpha crystallin family protein n=1 Tax=Salipaludibacillus sp. LMS25 TaxID=2924031 RepID=UPI0020D0FF44|nr:Hsp20/alpha crystallin family protein [Salipaludibacillus sp. LMS25]UTR13842.1 Hsp20/alpha crystallin family protein [Salipaludibacillus sp. LMS25]
MVNLFPKRDRELFEGMPSLFSKDGLTSLFDDHFKLQPRVDVKEEKDHYVIEAELPGFSKDDITVEYRDSYLFIYGKKETTEEMKDDDRFVRRERTTGTIKRKFYVGDIDETKINGNFTNGLLELTVPKSDADLEGSNGYRIDLK